MPYEERRVVEPADTVDTVPDDADVVRTAPDPIVEERVPAQTVVERRPVRRTVIAHDDPIGNAFAATQLIQTIVWSVVVLVLLVVALLALHVYAHLF
jgi:cell division protein FtsX